HFLSLSIAPLDILLSFLSYHLSIRVLYSFPTRRSSDLHSHNLLSFPLKKFYHKVKYPSLRVFFNPDDLHRFIKYVPMYIFSMISHTKTKELIYMPNKTENIGSKTTPHEDGRREGVLNDSTGVQIGITPTIELKKNPHFMDP